MEEKAIFFDRDGIIVRPVLGEATTKISQLRLIPQIIPVIRKARRFGYLIIVVSNQPDIALGRISESTKKALENGFTDLLKKNGLKIDGIYYCHHHPKGAIPKYTKLCKCQKPRPGMLLKAMKKFHIKASQSFMIGDRASDVMAGVSAGVKTILYDPNNLQKSHLLKHQVKPDYKIRSLFSIINLIEIKPAFVLAAGEGTRMLPLTKNIPKPLVKIDNKPMLEYVLDLLIKNGFNNIGINVFYMKHKIKKYLKFRKDSQIMTIEEKHLSGTGGAIKKIAQKLKPKQPFLVISSDMLINFNLTEIYKFHLRKKSFATICCYFRPKSKLNIKKSGLVLFNKKSKQVLEFTERPPAGNGIISRWVNSSVYIFNPQILELIPKKPIVDIAKDLIPILLELNKPVYAFPVNRKKFYQLGIDTPDRIKQAQQDIKSGKFRI